MNKGKCENCVFYEINDIDIDNGNWGWCHRFPPTLKQSGSDGMCGFSGVYKIDWCGEHKHREQLVCKEDLQEILLKNCTSKSTATRILCCLRRHGITTIDQLSKYTQDELHKFRGLGYLSLNALIDTLQTEGIRLK